MRIKFRPENEIKMRKRANIALLIFYSCFVIILVLSFIA
jgi:hypothetical protein